MNRRSLLAPLYQSPSPRRRAAKKTVRIAPVQASNSSTGKKEYRKFLALMHGKSPPAESKGAQRMPSAIPRNPPKVISAFRLFNRRNTKPNAQIEELRMTLQECREQCASLQEENHMLRSQFHELIESLKLYQELKGREYPINMGLEEVRVGLRECMSQCKYLKENNELFKNDLKSLKSHLEMVRAYLQ